jgi:hypothetical protein
LTKTGNKAYVSANQTWMFVRHVLLFPSYERHLERSRGRGYTTEQKAVDQAFHGIVDVEYKNCSPTREKIKADFISDQSNKQQFIGKLKESMK